MYDPECKGIFQLTRPLILASASPRRRDLLALLGLSFEIKPSSDKEPAWRPGLEPVKFALDLARIKGQKAAHEHKEAVVLSADTIVVSGKEVLGKPADRQEGFQMLMTLRGRPHQVITGFCIRCAELGLCRLGAVSTTVYIGDFPEEVLRSYADTGEGLDKAGSYAVQGVGSFLVERIEGSYTNVVGLPVTEIIKILLETGMIKVCIM